MNSELNSIKVIVWDLDGTLDYNPEAAVQMKSAFINIYRKHRKIGLDEANKIFVEKTKTMRWDEAVSRLTGMSQKDVLTKLEKIVKREKTVTKSPELVSMIKDLDKYRHVILTSASLKNTMLVLKKLGFPRNKNGDFIHFEKMFTLESNAKVKPDAGVFKQILRFTKLSAEQHLVIGDTVETDILPAKKLGFRTCLVYGRSNISDFSLDSIYKIGKLFRSTTEIFLNVKKISVFTLIFVSGFFSLTLEILGSKILAPFYASTIYVWSALISVALGFLALGYFIGGVVSSKYKNRELLFLVLIAASSLTMFLYMLKIPILNFSDRFGIAFSPLVAALLLFGAPFTFFGMATPCAIKLLETSNVDNHGLVGKILGINTLGSLFGAISAAYFLIPNFSTSQIIFGGSIVLFVVAVVVLIYFIGLILAKKYILYLLIILLVIIVEVFVRQIYLKKMSTSLSNRNVVYHRSTFVADYKIVTIGDGITKIFCLLVDSNDQGCINTSARVDSYHGYIAKAVDVLPKGSRVLILGGGIGEYFKYWDRNDVVFDIVDINPDTLEIYKQVGLGLTSDNHRFINSDARYYLRNTDKKYDLIYNDLLGNTSPITTVYTKEFNELAYQKLKSNGLFITHIIGKSNGTDDLVNKVSDTLIQTFPSSFVLSETPNSYYSYVVLLGQKNLDVVSYINNLISASDLGKAHPGAVFVPTRQYKTLILTDESNNMDYLWLNTIRSSYSIEDFRNKFKKNTIDDYY